MLKIIFLLLFFTILIVPSHANEQIPQWLYSVLSWWQDREISDEEFENNLKYLAKNSIISFSEEGGVEKMISLLQGNIISKETLSTERWIVWDGNISWEMFGNIKPHNAKFGAYTITILHIDYDIKPISGKNCVFELVNIKADAYLDNENSWAVVSMRTDMILAHEKGHFDLAKIYADKLNERLESLEGRNLLCAANNWNYSDEHILRYSAESYTRQIQDQFIQDLIEKDLQYDSETQHGSNSTTQLEWENKIDDLLK